VEKRRESLHGGMQRDPEISGSMGQVGIWVFRAFFLLLEDRDVSQVQADVSWKL
jgi:hypothetical protein